MISRRTAVALMAAPAVLRSQSNPRFAIAGFAHATNSFAPTPTAREDFESEIRRGKAEQQ